MSFIIIATSISSSTSSTRLPASTGGAAAALSVPAILSAAAGRGGCESLPSTGTDSVQRRPSDSQSNLALPPSWVSQVAVISLVPKPRDVGGAVAGPPLSVHGRFSRPALSSQDTLTVPDSDDSAPYLTALVASSCRASARICAVAGCSAIDGPPASDLAASARRW